MKNKTFLVVRLNPGTAPYDKRCYILAPKQSNLLYKQIEVNAVETGSFADIPATKTRKQTYETKLSFILSVESVAR